jgi:putative copper export protein/mono/diheme cytochrome c family protein
MTFALPVAADGLLLTGVNLVGSATGAGFGSWPGASGAGDILLDSSPGRALMTRTGMLIVLAMALVIESRHQRPAALLATTAAFVALGTFPFIGHAAGLRGTAAVAFDFIHVASAAIWGGGLLLIAITLWISRAHPMEDALVRLVNRFSVLALIVFTVIVVSGLAGAWFNVAGPRNLTGEDYGRVLVLKVVLSLLVVTAAAVNRLMLVPQLRRAEPTDQLRIARSLRGSAVIELGLAIIILLLAARLASIPPADRPLTIDVAARSGQIELASNADELTIMLAGNLANVPEGVLTITVIETATGAQVTDLARVIVDARAPDPLDPNAEPLQDRFDATPVEGEPGSFAIPRSRLGLETTWTVEIIARRLGVVDAVATWNLDFTGTAAQPPRLVKETWALPRIPWSGYLALVAAAVTAVGALLLIRRLKGLEPVTAGIILAVAGLITVGFLLSAWRSGPIPIAASDPNIAIDANDPAAIQRATPLWAMQCASCHGVDGGGTGDEQPDGGHAHPSVAGDLLGRQTQARTPAELYWIITNGLGGTTMPAFDLALTDQERADLVAYLLWLQKQSAD